MYLHLDILSLLSFPQSSWAEFQCCVVSTSLRIWSFDNLCPSLETKLWNHDSVVGSGGISEWFANSLPFSRAVSSVDSGSVVCRFLISFSRGYVLEKWTAEGKDSARRLTESFEMLSNLLNHKEISRHSAFIEWLDEQHHQQHRKCPLILRT